MQNIRRTIDWDFYNIQYSWMVELWASYTDYPPHDQLYATALGQFIIFNN